MCQDSYLDWGVLVAKLSDTCMLFENKTSISMQCGH